MSGDPFLGLDNFARSLAPSNVYAQIAISWGVIFLSSAILVYIICGFYRLGSYIAINWLKTRLEGVPERIDGENVIIASNAVHLLPGPDTGIHNRGKLFLTKKHLIFKCEQPKVFGGNYTTTVDLGRLKEIRVNTDFLSLWTRSNQLALISTFKEKLQDNVFRVYYANKEKLREDVFRVYDVKEWARKLKENSSGKIVEKGFFQVWLFNLGGLILIILMALILLLNAMSILANYKPSP